MGLSDPTAGGQSIEAKGDGVTKGAGTGALPGAARVERVDLHGADLRGANVEHTDFYLVDLRDAKFDAEQEAHFRRCGAILETRV